MKLPKDDLTHEELILMANKFNAVIGFDNPIDVDLPFDELLEEVTMKMLAQLPEGALDPKPGEPMVEKPVPLTI